MLEIYITVSGEKSLLGGACICAMVCQHGIPESLSKFIRRQPLGKLGHDKTLQKIFEYEEYLTYQLDFLEPYQGIDKYRRIRLSAQNLALGIQYKYKAKAKDVRIYQSKEISKSLDFTDVHIVPRIKANVGVSISHAFNLYSRRQRMLAISYTYPKLDVMSHYGNQAPRHYEMILRHGVTPLHDERTMEYVARYIQVQINTYCDTDGYTHYKNYFKSLPYWWRVASGYESLKEYFTDEEIVTMYENLYWCKKFYILKDAPIEDQVYKLPNIRKFPTSFVKFLRETNPYDDD